MKISFRMDSLGWALQVEVWCGVLVVGWRVCLKKIIFFSLWSICLNVIGKCRWIQSRFSSKFCFQFYGSNADLVSYREGSALLPWFHFHVFLNSAIALIPSAFHVLVDFEN